jgi:hypothetical protein
MAGERREGLLTRMIGGRKKRAEGERFGVGWEGREGREPSKVDRRKETSNERAFEEQGRKDRRVKKSSPSTVPALAVKPPLPRLPSPAEAISRQPSWHTGRTSQW